MRSKFKWIFTLLVALTMQFSFAQEKTITGTVSDASGPLPGVNVVVKGTQRGVSTGFDGSYSIKAKEGETLVYSFMGMREISKLVGSSNIMNTVMQDDSKVLGEVVVTAVNVKKAQNAITSSSRLVKSDELSQASNPNVAQALTGKVSGLQINTVSSGVASESKIVLRSSRSLTGNSEALVVIDGAISSTAILQQISPDLIESVNVLKGAQGAALYGSDGVNGVIIITTIKGAKSGKLSVDVSSSMDVSSVAYLPQSQLRYGQGWDGLFSNFENGSWGPEFDGSLQPVGLMQPNGSYYVLPYSPIKNNIKEFFTNGTILQNSVTISAGTLDEGYVTLGLNRTTNDFIVKGDALKRNSILFKAGKKIKRWTVEGNINYITQNVNQASSGDLNGGLYGDLLNTASNIPVQLFDHGINSSNWNVYFKNPYWTLNNIREINKDNRFAGNLTLGFEINKNINVTNLANVRYNSLQAVDTNNGFVDTYSAIYGASSKDEASSYFKSNRSVRDIYNDLLINFNYALTEKVGLKANLGGNIQDRLDESVMVGGENLDVPGVFTYANVLNPFSESNLRAFDGGSPGNRTFKKRKLGVFAQVDLNYSDYLFLNLTSRNDWSSVYSKANNSYFYPSAGISFVPTAMFDNTGFLNRAKVSANFTRVGNDAPVAIYDISQVVGLGDGFPFPDPVNSSFVGARGVTNPDIKPEFVTSKEANISLGFFNDRITLDASYYIQDTSNLITDVSTSFASGLNRAKDNIGDLRNKGFEIDLGVTPFKSEDPRGFRWDLKANYSTYKTTVESLKAGVKSLELRNAGIVGIFAEVGEEFPLIKGTTYTRDGFGRIIVDANGLPVINSEFKKLGKANPDYILGLNSSVSYKGFKLAATMDYRTGHKFYSDTKQEFAFNGKLIDTAENRSGFIMPNSSFDYDGDGTYEANEVNTSVVTGGSGTASYIGYINNRYTRAAENLVIDATAFKVRELSLSYSLSNKNAENIGLQALTFGVNARNFFTWLPKQNRGYNDPETAEASGNLTSGLAFNDRYPNQKTLGFSVNLKF